ncbi:MAG: hypothetical protein QOD69_494 [Solirubrobacteraceae bacterium]|nr:hypothetical protein [Solirubrobacteraceae bacterium]
MSGVPDPRDLLQSAMSALSGLGPRPQGDPEALWALARTLRQEADTAAALGRLERSVPDSMVFESRGARRLQANVAEVSESFFTGSRMIDEAADAIAREGHHIHDAQVAYDRSHRDLFAHVTDLEKKVREMKPW